MSFTEKNMYELLPAVYRLRDAELGYPLKALFAVLAREAGVMEGNIAALYENWFIETCDEWVIPYIGDLLGVQGLHPISGSEAVSQRAYVANTIRYRRRKGIAPVLEQLALDTAGWRAHVNEFFEDLATTQYMNHIRLHRDVAPDLRRMNQLDLGDTAFNALAHTADVRHINNRRGKYNIPNLGVFVWRIQPYPVYLSNARQLPPCAAGSANPGASFYTFSPLGEEAPLFNEPKTEDTITHISEEINVPVLLRRRALYDELEARRQAIAEGNAPEYTYFDDRPLIEDDPSTRQQTVFEIYKKGESNPIPPEEILICDLPRCCKPPKKKIYRKLLPNGSYQGVSMPLTVAVDPVRGKFLFTDETYSGEARVRYAYGFSGDLGSGTFNRQAEVDDWLQAFNASDGPKIQIGVSRSISAEGDEMIATNLNDAIQAWNNTDAGTMGIICIMDNLTYTESIEINIKQRSRLLIVAADWPVRIQAETGIRERFTGELSATDLRPHLNGDIRINGLTDMDLKTGGSVYLNGIFVEGGLRVKQGNLGELNLNYCTLLPGKGGIQIGQNVSNEKSNQWLEISLNRCICGQVDLFATVATSLQVTDSIIIHKQQTALQATNVPCTINNSTIIGTGQMRTLNASNSIFTETIIVQRRQEGCMRYCFVPGLLPQTPRRFQCQPETAINKQIKEEEKLGTVSAARKVAIRNQVMASLQPCFTSLNPHHYAFAQLHANCPEEIRTGADDGAEMGAFYFLKQPQRETNLRIAINEYLPLGMQAGVFFVT